jgi:dihydrodipicolinate synthase/N-acetylneuraminate lyase
VDAAEHRLGSPAGGSVVVALLTPFGTDGSVDVGALEAHVELLVEEGVHAVMPAGTTGEGPLLEEDEVVAAVAAAVRAARGRIEVLAHVGRPATDATVRVLRRAVDARATGVSAVVPYYYALDDAQVVAHYRAVLAAAEDTPLFAYSIPARTGNELSPAALRELVADGLAGVKDSTKSLKRHREYLDVGAPVLMGSDGLVLEALDLGAAGCVSAIANLRPDLLLGLTRASLAGRRDEAERCQRELSELRAELTRERPLVALKRAVADRVSGYPAALRRPLG